MSTEKLLLAKFQKRMEEQASTDYVALIEEADFDGTIFTGSEYVPWAQRLILATTITFCIIAKRQTNQYERVRSYYKTSAGLL